MKHPLLVVVCAAAILVGPTVLAQNDQSLPKVLATAKMAGACGILDQLVVFQGTTKLPGGDDFVARFWATEAARLGMSVKQMSDTCDRAVAGYDPIMKAAGGH